jgi:hypothetical protein
MFEGGTHQLDGKNEKVKNDSKEENFFDSP